MFGHRSASCGLLMVTSFSENSNLTRTRGLGVGRRSGLSNLIRSRGVGGVGVRTRALGSGEVHQQQK